MTVCFQTMQIGVQFIVEQLRDGRNSDLWLLFSMGCWKTFFVFSKRSKGFGLFGTQANGTHLANISNGGRKGRLGAPTETFRGAAGESKFSDAANWPIYSIDIYI